MYCRFCGQQIQDNAAVCEHCGRNQTDGSVTPPAQQEKKHQMSHSRLAMILVAGVVCVALVAAVVVIGIQSFAGKGGQVPSEPTVAADGNPDNVTCKGTYTAQKDALLAANSNVVATMGDNVLTNEELQIYYWMQFYEFYENYSYYASSLGLDVSKGMDTQRSPFSFEEGGTGMTWQQYFLSCALESWRRNQGLYNMAVKNGFQMPAYYLEALENIEQSLLENAQDAGVSSALELLQNDMGPGATMESYKKYLQTYYLGYAFYAEEVSKIQIPKEDVESYFEENKDTLKEDGVTLEDTDYYVDVRHILIKPVGDTEDAKTFTDAQWEACRQQAQAILDQWLKEGGGEDSFAALAEEKSQDDGSKYVGGLYENVARGKMTAEFNDWIFDEARQTGDYGLVKTTYGYHVMYFVGSTPKWYVVCENALLKKASNELLETLLAEAKVETDYASILLGEANLG